MVQPVVALLKRIELSDLLAAGAIQEVRILSLMPSLYTLRVRLAGEEYVVTERGKGIRRSSAESLRALFSRCEVARWRLQHASAYDEMVGQPEGGDNVLEVRLGPPEPGPLH